MREKGGQVDIRRAARSPTKPLLLSLDQSSATPVDLGTDDRYFTSMAELHG